MFKGKIYVHRNNNGKIEEFEKEFDNLQDFLNFKRNYNQPEFEEPMLWLTWWTNLQNYFNNLIDRRFWLRSIAEPEEEQQYLPNWVNLDEYEKEIQNMEYEEAHKNEKLQWLKNTLAKLNEYLKKFKDKWRDDMIKKIKKDIESTQKEIDTLEK